MLNLFCLILDEVTDLHSYSSYFRLSFYRPRAFFSVTKKNVDLVQKYKTVFCGRNQIKGQKYCNLHFFPFNLLYCLLSMLFVGIVYFYTKIDFIVQTTHVIFNYSTLFLIEINISWINQVSILAESSKSFLEVNIAELFSLMQNKCTLMKDGFLCYICIYNKEIEE